MSVTKREFMYVKEGQQPVMAPRPAETDRSQQILGGALWLGLTALLVYISS